MPVSAGKRGVLGSAAAALALAMAALLLLASSASAANPYTAGTVPYKAPAGSKCPPIKNKPSQIKHVDYQGVRHITYCVPATVNPGQNVIRLHATNLLPKQPGYITRFDPDLVYTNGTVPRVDVVHLHHAVWIVNGNPQFAVGEEKTIVQAPRGFGWRSLPTDKWYLNDMLHDLVGQQAHVYIIWRIDFVPDSSPAAAKMHTIQTKWMSVAGPQPRDGISSQIYPVFNALKGWGKNGRYTFPDQATGGQRRLISPNQTWTPSHPVTLIETAGHLHPGGLNTTLRVRRGDKRNKLFTSKAHYYEPAGEVSWDVAMGATPRDWRVKVPAGDKLSVHATYNTKDASWYEVMGIMPVAVYNGTDVGGVGDFSKKIPQNQRLTHTHLAENRHHGGGPTSMPDALKLPDGPFMTGRPVNIQGYLYSQGDLHNSGAAGRPPVIHAGQQLAFKNLDDAVTPSTWHTVTACKQPCNRDTGIAYPIANGSTQFDSGQLGTNPPFGAPASGSITWKTPKNLKPGTYTYFCRVHPFMRGSFRVKR
jgi:plastocyanin